MTAVEFLKQLDGKTRRRRERGPAWWRKTHTLHCAVGDGLTVNVLQYLAGSTEETDVVAERLEMTGNGINGILRAASGRGRMAGRLRRAVGLP